MTSKNTIRFKLPVSASPYNQKLLHGTDESVQMHLSEAINFPTNKHTSNYFTVLCQRQKIFFGGHRSENIPTLVEKKIKNETGKLALQSKAKNLEQQPKMQMLALTQVA